MRAKRPKAAQELAESRGAEIVALVDKLAAANARADAAERRVKVLETQQRADANDIQRALTGAPEHAGPDPTFEQAWSEKEAEGYQYGEEALERVRFGWELACGKMTRERRMQWLQDNVRVRLALRRDLAAANARADAAEREAEQYALALANADDGRAEAAALRARVEAALALCRDVNKRSTRDPNAVSIIAVRAALTQ